MNFPMMWIVLLVVLILIEFITMGLTTIWFAGGALVALILASLGASFVVQMIGFLLVSFVLLYFTRPIALRFFNSNRTRTNVESMIGRKSIVTETIDNLKETGQVREAGIEWMARSVSDDHIIEKGRVVQVVEVKGVKLIVKDFDDTAKSELK